MKRRLLSILAVLLVAFAVNAQAASRGTSDEAKAMVDKAAKLIASDGKDKAYAAFQDPAGGFIDRDLYVFVIDMGGVTVAHGGNKALVGKSLANLKDADGLEFIQQFIKTAKSSGEGWVDYKWPNPATKKVEPKSSYVKRVGDVVVGVGIYKD